MRGFFFFFFFFFWKPEWRSHTAGGGYGAHLVTFSCLTHRLSHWHSIIRTGARFGLTWTQITVSPPEGFPRWTSRCFPLLLFLPPPYFRLHMLRGDGRQRVWVQFTPDIPGTIRNHFLPICLIAAITYRSDLLSFPPPCVPSSDGSPIDLPALKISKRTERRPSRCASQLSTICQPLVKGDSLSLLKDPIHSDLLKVLMLITLSLLASW